MLLALSLVVCAAPSVCIVISGSLATQPTPPLRTAPRRSLCASAAAAAAPRRRLPQRAALRLPPPLVVGHRHHHALMSKNVCVCVICCNPYAAEGRTHCEPKSGCCCCVAVCCCYFLLAGAASAARVWSNSENAGQPLSLFTLVCCCCIFDTVFSVSQADRHFWLVTRKTKAQPGLMKRQASKKKSKPAE
jgi:hypothetical protein